MTAFFLNIFGVPDEGLIAKLRGDGWDGFRIDILSGRAEENTAKIKAAAKLGGRWNFLIWGGNYTWLNGRPATYEEWFDLLQTTVETIASLPFDRSRVAIELGNEPNIAAGEWRSLTLIAQTVVSGQALIRRQLGAEVTIITPGVSNADKAGIGWASAFLGTIHPLFWDSNLVFGLHRYPVKDDPAVGQRGWGSRAEEDATIEVLREQVGVLWITETGLSQGPHRGRKWGIFPYRYMLDERTWAARLEAELRHWGRPDVAAVTLYQINDSPDPSSGEHYGLRRSDGSWKDSFSLKRVRGVTG